MSDALLILALILANTGLFLNYLDKTSLKKHDNLFFGCFENDIGQPMPDLCGTAMVIFVIF